MGNKLKLLSGNEAIARGAYEAGVNVVSSYPGTPSTEITYVISKYKEVYTEWATNEKVALEVVMGASLAGARALTAMKHVGVNVASDPLMTASYTGVNGAAVLIVADDPNMYSSQNEQDSRHYARLSKLPMLEPSDSQEALDYVKKAFELSERFKCLTIVRATTRLSHSMSPVLLGERVEVERVQYKKDPSRWVMTPANARRRHFDVEDRLNNIKNNVAEEFVTETIKDTAIGIVTSGAVYQYVSEAMPRASILKLGMVWPLPIEKIREFSSKIDKLFVIEELDPIIENELLANGINVEHLNRSICGELSVEAVEKLFGIENRQRVPFKDALPPRPPNLCAGCSHRGIYYAIKRLNLTVTGDIGCYTLGTMEPLAALDSCLCMGASVTMAHGFDKGLAYSKGAEGAKEQKRAVAIIGDSTFLHTGVNGLINTVYNKGASTVIIVDNRITGMTGHQPNAASGFSITGEVAPMLDLELLCKAIGVKTIDVVDPFDTDRVYSVLKEHVAKDETTVVIARRACIFADKNFRKPPYTIDKDACSGCRACLRIGCPSISWNSENQYASIDQAQCVGCGLCSKVCRFDSISQRDV